MKEDDLTTSHGGDFYYWYSTGIWWVTNQRQIKADDVRQLICPGHREKENRFSNLRTCGFFSITLSGQYKRPNKLSRISSYRTADKQLKPGGTNCLRRYFGKIHGR